MTTVRWIALLCLFLCASPAGARPFTVDDLLHLEDIGPGIVDPTGRWLIQEFEPRYDQSPRFDKDVYYRPMLAKLLKVDLHNPGPAKPAFPQDPRGGYVAGPFSPDGRSLVVYRSLDRSWDIGILTIASERVRWLGFGVDFADRGDTVAWRSNSQLVALRLAPGDSWWKAPLWDAAMQRLPQLWRDANAGTSATAVATGSGRYRDVHPSAPPRQLVEVDLPSGRVRSFSSGLYTSMALSRSGRAVALIESSERASLSSAALISQTTQLRVAHLQILDLDHGVLSTPCSGEPLIESLRWSSGADRLMAYTRPRNSDWAHGSFVIADHKGGCAILTTGELKPEVTSETEGATPTAHADWLGEVPILLATAPGARRAEWYALSGHGAIDLTSALSDRPKDPILIDGGRAVFLNKQIPWSVGLYGPAAALSALKVTRTLPPRHGNNSTGGPDGHAVWGRELFAVAVRDDRTTLMRLTGTTATEVAHAPTQPEKFVAAADAGLLTDTRDAHGVQRLALWQSAGREVLLLKANASLENVDFAPPREIDHLGPNGEPLKSWLYLPPQRTISKPPLLVIAYPGSVSSSPALFGEPGSFLPVSDNVQLAVAHGYAVLVPSLPTPAGSVDPGKGWSKPILDIVDKIKQTGWVDTDRLAYWGQSFGGYVGLMLATETDRFQAIVAAAPISDLISFRAQGWAASWLSSYDDTSAQLWAGWSELGTQGHLLGTPWTQLERYIDNSPVFRADRIQTPILLVQGDQDPAGIGQGREMFSDLSRLGKDALFLTFYGEGHSIVSPQNVRRLDHDAFEFLDKIVKYHAPPPNAEPTPQQPPS